MSLIKKNIGIILIFLCLIALAGCNNTYQKSIYSDNSKIVQSGDSYSFKTRIGNQIDNNMDVQFSVFNGMQTIWTIDIKQNSKMKINYISKIDSGKFKVVLVTPDKKIINILENSKESSDILDIPPGKNIVKIIGYNAKGNIKMDYKLE